MENGVRIGKYKMMQERSRLRWRRVIILGSARVLLRYEEASTNGEVIPFRNGLSQHRYWLVWWHRRARSVCL